ncbi:MAG: hypothetical protein LBG59_08725 [Candidatus Peribacteria bacterium]|nr:hypothetical protein [Candidatus Peribacteria bacterium]
MLGLLLIINICFFFQSYPRHGLIPFLGTVRDVKQYLSLFILIIGSITIIKRNRKRFY